MYHRHVHVYFICKSALYCITLLTEIVHYIYIFCKSNVNISSKDQHTYMLEKYNTGNINVDRVNHCFLQNYVFLYITL